MNKRSKKDSIELDTKSLVREAVKELQKMLKDPSEKVRIRAIGIILKYSERISLLMREKSNDPLSLELDSIIKGLENDLKELK